MKKNKIAIVGLCGQSLFMRVDHFHRIGESIFIDEMFTEPGGKGFNQAATIAKLGGNVAFLGSVGKDHAGEACKKYLIDNNIESFVVEKDIPTAMATILFNKDGDNQVSIYKGASAYIDNEDLKEFEETIKESEILLLQLETPIEIVKKAIAMAKKYKTKIILNPAPAVTYYPELLNEVWLLTPNEHEARTIFNIPSNVPSLDLGYYFIAKGIERLVVTLGGEGVLVIENQQFYYVHALKHQDPVIDTTGAGDVFNGALTLAILNGKTLEEAVSYGVLVSGLSVRKKYAIASIPSPQEIENCLNNK